MLLESKKKLQELFSFSTGHFPCQAGCTLLNDHNPKELYFSSGLFINKKKEKKKEAFVCILHQLGAHANTKHNC